MEQGAWCGCPGVSLSVFASPGEGVHLKDFSTDAAAGRARAMPGEQGVRKTACSGAETPSS